jgi:hypothetical protein
MVSLAERRTVHYGRSGDNYVNRFPLRLDQKPTVSGLAVVAATRCN